MIDDKLDVYPSRDTQHVVATGGTLHKERARTPDRRGRGGPSQEDARSYAQRRGNVISQWSSVHQGLYGQYSLRFDFDLTYLFKPNEFCCD